MKRTAETVFVVAILGCMTIVSLACTYYLVRKVAESF